MQVKTAPVRVTLRSHREGIEALEKAGFSVQPVRYAKGDHLFVKVSLGDTSACVPISGSPRGSFLHPLVAGARRAVREAASRA